MNTVRITPDLTVADVNTTTAFYSDIAGLQTVMDGGWVTILADPGRPEVQLLLLTRDATAPINPDVSIQVDDVEAAYAAARARGAEIVHPLTAEPWGVRRFFVRDPDGRVVNVLAHL
ncbi:MAG: VOC family protein [Nakamurella sp.]